MHILYCLLLFSKSNPKVTIFPEYYCLVFYNWRRSLFGGLITDKQLAAGNLICLPDYLSGYRVQCNTYVLSSPLEEENPTYKQCRIAIQYFKA